MRWVGCHQSTNLKCPIVPSVDLLLDLDDFIRYKEVLGKDAVKAAARGSISAESSSQVICIYRGNMEGERDPASQSQFNSPVQQLLGLCILSLWSSVENVCFALKMGMGTFSHTKELQNRAVSIRQQFMVRENVGVRCTSCLWLQLHLLLPIADSYMSGRTFNFHSLHELYF